MSQVETQYLGAVRELLDRYKADGQAVGTNNRTAVNATKKWCTMIRHDFSEGFPLLTTKRVYWLGVVTELVGFLAALTNNDDFNAIGKSVWDEWALEEDYYSVIASDPVQRLVDLANAMGTSTHEADKVVQASIAQYGFEIGMRKAYEDRGIEYEEYKLVQPKGALGPIYGAQWRNFDNSAVDQLAEVINKLQIDPLSRRHLVVAWNPKVLPDETRSAQQNVIEGKQALPPCHYGYQFDVDLKADGTPVLSSVFMMRSADMFLGVPFNLSSYGLLVSAIAHDLKYELGESVAFLANYHLYHNHIEQAETMLEREPRPLPKLVFPKEFSLWKILSCKGSRSPKTLEILKEQVSLLVNALVDYDPHPSIKGEVAV